jgi:hypothetical protein
MGALAFMEEPACLLLPEARTELMPPSSAYRKVSDAGSADAIKYVTREGTPCKNKAKHEHLEESSYAVSIKSLQRVKF